MAINPNDTASINLEKIAVMRGNRLILQNFSLRANAGDVIWLRGANGSGKSTLLRVIAGLLPVLSGTVAVTGAMSLVDMVAVLDETRSLEKALSYWANLDGSSADRREAALKSFDLSALADVPVRYLSSGQKKRAALAMAAASPAPIWLLDEPYNALDSANMARLDEAILRHVASGGLAIVAAHQPPTIAVTETISLDGNAGKGIAA
jgi:heme exporter protein A